jgi:hypothetical protein
MLVKLRSSTTSRTAPGHPWSSAACKDAAADGLWQIVRVFSWSHDGRDPLDVAVNAAI